MRWRAKGSRLTCLQGDLVIARPIDVQRARYADYEDAECTEPVVQVVFLLSYRYAVITHGSPFDPFWTVVRNGADAAAQDFGVSVSI